MATNTLSRVARKGGRVIHLAATENATVCGRVPQIAGREGQRLCKTCKRITGVVEVTENNENPYGFKAKAYAAGQYKMFQEALLVATDPRMIAYYEFQLAHRNLRADGERASIRKADTPTGDGMVNPKGAVKEFRKPRTGASEAQAKWILSMAEQIDVFDPEANMAATCTPEFLDNLSWDTGKGRVSVGQFIDTLKELLADHKRNATMKASDAPKTFQGEFVPVADGMYKKDDVIYKVATSRESGKQWAKRMVELAEPIVKKTTTQTHTFEFAGSPEKVGLTVDHLLSLADAKTFGRKTGSCCVCGRLLTNGKSIEAGIGPICADKF